MRTNWLQSARARFAVTASVVLALVALGGVTAAPASAAPVTVTITVHDIAQGGLLPNRALALQSSDGVTSYNYTTSSSAEFTAQVEEGSYRLVPGGQYAPSEYFTLSPGQTAISVDVTKPTVSGSIPAAAASGHTAVGIEIWYHFEGSANYFWSEINGFTINSADGTFSQVLQTGTGKYRLHFKPDATVPYLDSYSPEFTADGSVAALPLGPITLTPAGGISGTVTSSSGGAIAGAAITATSGGATLGTATTMTDGTYFIKVAASAATVTVSAAAAGFTGASSAPASLNAGNSFAATGVNVALARLPINLSGTTAGGNVVDTFLYKKDGTGKYAQTPYRSTLGSASFSYPNLPDGDYRIAFRSPTTQRTLVWSSLSDNSSTIGSSDTYGSCYYGFTLSPATGSRTLANISLAAEQIYPASCSTPAYADPSDPTVTGQILNKADLPYITYAKLYEVGVSGATVVDTSQVEVDGTFSLSGVREAGDYYIKIEPYQENDSYLTTLLGANGDTAWAKDQQTEADFAADHAFAVDPATSTGLSGHDVTLELGAQLAGYVVASTGQVNAKVTLADATDPTDTIAVPLNSYGGFATVVPVGGSYTILAESVDGAYAPEYWNNVSSLGQATVVGPLVAGLNGEYGFELEPSPPVIFGYVSDVAQSWPITVHLYKKDSAGLWQPVGEMASVSEAVKFSGLTAGDYRMRFERNGDWMSATSYRTGTLANRDTAYTTDPSCFVDFAGVAAGLPSFVEANFDSDLPYLGCAAEPPTKGDVTGQLVSSLATGSVTIEGALVTLINVDTFAYVETASGANGYFTFADVANGDYVLSVAPAGPHETGDSDYRYYGEFTFAGGEDVGTITPLRLGNVSGQILNWDNDTMSGARATVYHYCTCTSSWESTNFSTDIVDGFFEIPAIYESGQYSVRITFDDTYVDGFIGGGTLEPTAPFTGTEEQDYAYPDFTLDLVELVTISGTAFYGDFPLDGGDIYAEGSDGSYYYGDVLADGSYSVAVPPNDDYVVSAEYEPLMDQYYAGYNYDDDYQGVYTGDSVPVGATGVGAINFSLIASQNDYFYVNTMADGGFGNYGLYDVKVHLYQYVVDGWVEVDSGTYTPADLASSGGGDYRLRFERNGEWLRVDELSWSNDLPPFDESDGSVAVDSCYVEFTDLPHGSDLSIETILDADNAATSGCAAEGVVVHREVSGATVFDNNPVADQTVTLTNTSTAAVFTRTTDATGAFTFADVSDGTYTLDIPRDVASDGHSYEAISQTVVVSADVALGAIELTRYGNAELTIINWNASLAGTTAELRIEGPAGTWTAVGSDVVDGGDFVIPGILDSGSYRIWMDYPAGLIDGYAIDATDMQSVLTVAGVAEEDSTTLRTAAFTTVSGMVRSGASPVAGAAVVARLSTGGTSYLFSATTAADGNYTLSVPAGFEYGITVTKTGLTRAATYGVAVGFEAGIAPDLDMHYAEFASRVFQPNGAGGYVLAPSVTVHLYKQVTGGWQEVATSLGHPSNLWTNLSGSYRMRVSDGADWLAIDTYESSSNAGWTGVLDPTPDVCFIDFGAIGAGYRYETTFNLAATGSTACSAEPAVTAPAVTPGATGSGTKKPVATAPVTSPATDAAATTEDPESTSTPTPTPSPSETETDAPDDATGVEKPATASAPDFTWAFWVAGILVLLVLAGGAVYFVRRRA